MTEPAERHLAEELVEEITERARHLAEAHLSREVQAAIDWDQFEIGARFATGAATLVLRERNLLRAPPTGDKP